MKISPNDAQTGDSFRFLLSAMSAMKRKNPLAESFLVQLEIDLEGLGMQSGWNPPLHVRNHAVCTFLAVPWLFTDQHSLRDRA